jgi:TetR/AcrR family transcriptional repressor of nem operon
MSKTETIASRSSARTRILDAAMTLIRQKGYAATRVDDICAAAGVTKGAFFHHFASKEALGVAAAEHWSLMTGTLFEDAPYHDHADALARVLAYIGFRRAILQGTTGEFTCLVGTLAQETHISGPAIAKAARASIFGHAATLEPDITEAKAQHCPEADWTPESLALFTQATLQGAFILAKADGGPDVARQMVDHLDRYVRLLFGVPAHDGGPRQ